MQIDAIDVSKFSGSTGAATDVEVNEDTTFKIPTLPNELWLYIAMFIAPCDRPKLLGINRVLFELVMSERYRLADFIRLDPRLLAERLRSFQDPNLSKHVRVVVLHPALTRQALRMREKLKFQLLRPLLQGRNYVGELVNHRQWTSESLFTLWRYLLEDPPLPSSKQRTQMFIRAFWSFTLVEKFEITWPYDLGPSRSAQWKFSFFPEIWDSLGRNLRQLSIDVHVFKLSDVVKDCGPLLRLEQLHLNLRFGHPRGHPNDTVVPSFINKLAPTLRHLSIKTNGHHEFSTTFQLLGHFPQLTQLSLNIPLDALHLRDASGLRQLLLKHPDVEHFCMRYKLCCTKGVYDGFESVDGKHVIYSDIALPAMHTLELGLNLDISNQKTHLLYQNIASLGSNLTTLILQDCIMDIEEIMTVLRIFPSHRLKKLLFMARKLSHELIDHLACVCLSLESLSIHAGQVKESNSLPFPLYNDTWSTSDWHGFEVALAECAELHVDRYATWALSDVSILRWKHKVVQHVYDWKCMLAIAKAVPSVRSFAGCGHMNPDTENVHNGTTKVETLLDVGSLFWDRHKYDMAMI